jgi:hypothetical protein
MAPNPCRQVDALLHLIRDVGFEVETSPTGHWIFSEKDRQGRRMVVGVDSARKVASVANLLADALQVDRQLLARRARTHAHAHCRSHLEDDDPARTPKTNDIPEPPPEPRNRLTARRMPSLDRPETDPPDTHRS